jgi:hypothetical protein
MNFSEKSMKHVGGKHEGQSTPSRRVITATVLGSVLEWAAQTLRDLAAKIRDERLREGFLAASRVRRA